MAGVMTMGEILITKYDATFHDKVDVKLSQLTPGRHMGKLRYSSTHSMGEILITKY